MKTIKKVILLNTLIILLYFFSNHPKANATSMEGIEIIGFVADGFDYNEYIEVKGKLKRFGCNFTLTGL